ncbi:Glycerate kinase [Metarhizium anisopliae]|nr:Glycerate kinase [Metarhizium anisopliae]
MKPLRILIAPSGFKESLEPDEAAACIEKGIRRVLDSATSIVRRMPVHDGGEGFCNALVAAKGGEIRPITVLGPHKTPIPSHYGVIGEDRRTAVLDMASAAGLRLVRRDCRDPTATTSYGVGQLIAAALDEGCTKIIIGCGDSGTSDGGAGMLQALGARLLDDNDQELPTAAGGGSLIHLRSICLDGLHPRLLDSRSGGQAIEMEAVCNIKNILCGSNGVARVYGPQKGATPAQVNVLSRAMDNLARAATPVLGYDMSSAPGGGASGGLGAGLLLLGARLRPRVAAIDEYFQLQQTLDSRWDIVFTAEGALDSQSTKGKMTGEVARKARAQGAYVIALVGTISTGANSVYEDGFSAFSSILDSPLSLDDAIQQTASLLTSAAERTMRVVQVGLSLQSRDGL